MKLCSSCGAQASAGMRKCLACGSASFLYICENCNAHFTARNCPQCGVLRETREKVCPNCGRHTFDAHCPDCGASLRNIAPIRAEIPPETYAVHAGGISCHSDGFEQVKAKKRESGCGIVALVLSLIGYWCSQDIGLPGLSFLVPALVFFAIGLALARANNRRAWSLIASGALIALSAVMLAFAPNGWGR